MAFAIPYWRYGGAAAGGAFADYADVKFKPISDKITNSEAVAGAAIALDVFGLADRYGRHWADAVDGVADWGVGMLAAGVIRRHLTAPITVAVPTSTTKGVPSSTVTSTYHAGLTGVPAANSSASADIAATTTGY